MKQQKIGIMGGSFNPIHHAHLRNMQSALEAFNLDKIIVIPSGVPVYETSKQLESAYHRKQMVSLAIASNPLLELDTLELDTPGKHYTYDTVQILKEKYPYAQFYFIIGGDMIDTLHTWYRIDELIKDVTFIGINRMGAHNTSNIPFKPLILPLLEISSSQLRKDCQNQKSIRYLVPDAVADYIKQECLYVD